MKRNIDRYTTTYRNLPRFESEMVHYRRRLVLERLHRYRPKTIIELGCGSELQATAFYQQGGNWIHWTIVEPSREFAQTARESELMNLEVIERPFEDAVSMLTHRPPVDIIICSGLLHEVVDSDLFIRSMSSLMGPETVLHINVPNSESFHRRLGVAMGIIDETTAMSGRNVALQQHRVYSLTSLTDAVKSHDLEVIHTGGYFIKPFTHDQMSALGHLCNRRVLDGLDTLGRVNPDWASEIFVEVSLQNGIGDEH